MATSKGKDQNTHLRTAGVVHFLISHTGFQETWILDYNGWIPDSISWIPDSKAVDSGFHRPKLPGFRIPDSGLPYMGRQLKVNFFVLLRVVLLVSQA